MKRLSIALIRKHRNYAKCPYSELDLIASGYVYGRIPCPCRTFPCCYEEVQKEIAKPT